MSPEGCFYIPFLRFWDSADSDQSYGGFLMNQVPIVHATEMLARAFGVVAASVRRQSSGSEDVTARFDVVDVAGRQWRLEAAPARRQAGHDAWPPGATRWGRHWMLSEVPAAQDGQGGATPPQPDRVEPAPSCRPHAWECADGRALERVGSWLAQPAGLPTATDIPGQAFVDTWLSNRQQIATMHARAEALHDALARHASVVGPTPAGGAASRVCNEAYRHQRVLRHLVETQQLLLGPQAAVHPVAVRRQALRRLNGLLESERARLLQEDTLWQAGAG